MHKTDREYKELAIVPHMSDSRFATELSVSFRNSGIDPALSNPSAGHAQSDAGFTQPCSCHLQGRVVNNFYFLYFDRSK
jgi:hypothetical protein